MRLGPKTSRGFTLIELLVVIAIIAILSAILFPVFARARENARRASCLSNMKQIGLAITMYTQDYDEYLPVASGLGPSTTTWRTYIYSYVRSAQVFICPSRSITPDNNSKTFSNGGTDATQGITTGLASHYAASSISDNSVANTGPFCGAPAGIRVNALGIAQSYPAGAMPLYTGTAPYNGSYKLSVFNEPAQLIMVAEGNQGNGTNASVTPIFEAVTYSTGDIRGLWSGHLGTSNYLFVDGHVKSLKPAATASPYDMWDINKQDTACTTLLTGAQGTPGTAPYYGNLNDVAGYYH